LHNNGPDVHAKIEDNNSAETYLCAAPLTEALHVKDETKTEAANDAEEWRDEGRECTSADAEVSGEVS